MQFRSEVLTNLSRYCATISLETGFGTGAYAGVIAIHNHLAGSLTDEFAYSFVFLVHSLFIQLISKRRRGWNPRGQVLQDKNAPQGITGLPDNRLRALLQIWSLRSLKRFDQLFRHRFSMSLYAYALRKLNSNRTMTWFAWWEPISRSLEKPLLSFAGVTRSHRGTKHAKSKLCLYWTGTSCTLLARSAKSSLSLGGAHI